jgi:RNA polymerase sigma-70 factor, ECF subfamily
MNETLQASPAAREAESHARARDIVLGHAPFVCRTLRYLGVPEADVMDAAQEVFLVIHKKLDAFEGRSTLQTWIYGICHRIALAHRRRRVHRREDVTSTPPEVAIAATQGEELEMAEARSKVLRLLDALDSDKRAVFVLYEIEKMSMKDVAEVLKCPLQTAYYRYHAARKAIEDAFATLAQEGP